MSAKPTYRLQRPVHKTALPEQYSADPPGRMRGKARRSRERQAKREQAAAQKEGTAEAEKLP